MYRAHFLHVLRVKRHEFRLNSKTNICYSVIYIYIYTCTLQLKNTAPVSPLQQILSLKKIEMYRAHFLDVLGVKRHELRVLGGRLHLLIIIISPISTSNSPIIISSPTHINVWNKYRFQFRIVYIKKKVLLSPCGPGDTLWQHRAHVRWQQ